MAGPTMTAGLRMAVLLVLAALSVTQASAAVHPVPLAPNTDAAKCLECHADKSKGKAVHSAIAIGCLSCHEVRVNKDTTRVKLITATPYKLCLSCHSDKDATQIKGHVHQPAIRDCLTCHDPHTSDNKNQLLKATSGAKKDNLCLRERMFRRRAAVTLRSTWGVTPATLRTRLALNGRPKISSI
jgi:predicted CXXCH cytochrome family protein